VQFLKLLGVHFPPFERLLANRSYFRAGLGLLPTSAFADWQLLWHFDLHWEPTRD
jgi:hypothetical protein